MTILRSVLHILCTHIIPCPPGVYNIRSLSRIYTHARINLIRNQLTFQLVFGVWDKPECPDETTNWRVGEGPVGSLVLPCSRQLAVLGALDYTLAKFFFIYTLISICGLISEKSFNQGSPSIYYIIL